MSSQPQARLANWDTDRELIRQIRQSVFVIEQHVEPELEWDGEDEHCLHALAGFADSGPVATGRLQPDGKIGRMAVLKPWRGCGLGNAILDCLLEAARGLPLDAVYLHAQTHALAFYARAGFVAEGPEFDEAGIAHRTMRLNLGSDR